MVRHISLQIDAHAWECNYQLDIADLQREHENGQANNVWQF